MNSKISITMISNGMSHHQLPFCEYMDAQECVDFHFIATKPVAKERLDMGYDDLNESGSYIVRSYETDAAYDWAMKLAEQSDFVIYGSAPYEYISSRIKNKKWTFIYSERIFKKGLRDKTLLKKLVSYFLHYAIVPHDKIALLCASAYAAKDFALFGLGSEKMYKWGYFPPDTKRTFYELANEKERNSIVWVGRMIDWKHPELPICLAKRLVDEQIPFHMTLVGNGTLYDSTSDFIREHNLQKYITMTGSLPKDEVRSIMEQSDILLATSDYAEGWGAVINEGMNSGCAVVASHAMGATRFLIEDEKNGMVFESGNLQDLYRKTRFLLEKPEKKKEIQEEAFYTIKNEWNGENAGRKLIYLCQQLLDEKEDFCFSDGVCSRAEVNMSKCNKRS